MKPLALLVALGWLGGNAIQASTLAFTRDGYVCVSDLEGKHVGKSQRGSWPEISPDGTHIAFNTETEKMTDRQISVVNLAAFKTTPPTLLKDVPSTNCHSPAWSPDSSKLLFYLFVDGDWQLGQIDADGKNFRYVRKADSNHNSYWGARWAADGRSIYCHDLDAIYQLNLDGKVLQKWVLSDLVPRGGFNSGSSLAPSPDGKSLLLDVDMDEDVTIKDWEGPPPAIWKLDLASGKATRVSPPGLFAWQPCWLSADEFLFTNMKNGDKDFSIWRQKLDGSNRSLVIKNASVPSVSRK